MSDLLTKTLPHLDEEDERWIEAREGMLADLERGYNLGTGGSIAWSRESMYER